MTRGEPGGMLRGPEGPPGKQETKHTCHSKPSVDRQVGRISESVWVLLIARILPNNAWRHLDCGGPQEKTSKRLGPF